MGLSRARACPSEMKRAKRWEEVGKPGTGYESVVKAAAVDDIAVAVVAVVELVAVSARTSEAVAPGACR